MRAISIAHRYLRHVFTYIADHSINRIDQLLTWNVADQLQQQTA